MFLTRRKTVVVLFLIIAILTGSYFFFSNRNARPAPDRANLVQLKEF